uniref:Carbonyl reductase 1 n=1 Tax=Cyprinus carpio TaxID=7962 RepID=A0A8C1JR58_CYPCA
MRPAVALVTGANKGIGFAQVSQNQLCHTDEVKQNKKLQNAKFVMADTTPLGIQANVTLKTNFFATRDMCNVFLPIIKPGGQIVNVSNEMGLVALSRCSPELQARSEAMTFILHRKTLHMGSPKLDGSGLTWLDQMQPSHQMRAPSLQWPKEPHGQFVLEKKVQPW